MLRLSIGRTVRQIFTVVGLLAGLMWPGSAVIAQQNPSIPSFWDPQEQFIKPNVKELPRLRFLTTTDFPPFSFIDKDKRLSGFHVDLARAICSELELLAVCQIQALPFEELQTALEEGRGEAIIAGMVATRSTREALAFSRPYFWLPARFVARRDTPLQEPLSRGLKDLEVGVVEGTSHAAMASAKFGDLRLRMFDNQDSALAALKDKKVSAVFGDGLSLAFWLQSREPDAECCRFVGGPYLSTTYLGSGLSIAVSKENRQLEEALNYALRTIDERGTFAELYLRYFPLGLF